MPRYFAPISIPGLEDKIAKIIDSPGLRDHLEKDLKVGFDWENWTGFRSRDFGPKSILGSQTLDSGLTFWGFCAGGDWEFPVFFIVYWDGKKLRGYIPTEGNPWNTTTKEAYGNDGVADNKNACKRWPHRCNNKTGLFMDAYNHDPSAILSDIAERILPQPNKGRTKKPKPPLDLPARIEALEFWGTGDEGYELFQQSCGYCYSLCGLGYDAEAEVVYLWTRDMAEASKRWWQEENPDVPCNDIGHGVYGYN